MTWVSFSNFNPGLLDGNKHAGTSGLMLVGLLIAFLLYGPISWERSVHGLLSPTNKYYTCLCDIKGSRIHTYKELDA